MQPIAPSRHHHHSRRQYQRAADQPRVSYGSLGAAPPSPLDAVAKPPSLARLRSFFRRCRAQTAFLVANAGLAVCAALLSLALLGCALVSLPLCCVGALVFRLIFQLGIVSTLAKADVALANTVLPPDDRIRLEPAMPSARDPLLLRSPPPLHPLLREDRVLDRVITNLTTVAPTPVMALVYFAAFKWMLALLGFGLVCVLLWAPLAFVQSLAAAAPRHSPWHEPMLALAFVAAVSSLNLATRVCCSCTRLFCCERDRETDSPALGALTKVVVVRVADGW